MRLLLLFVLMSIYSLLAAQRPAMLRTSLAYGHAIRPYEHFGTDHSLKLDLGGSLFLSEHFSAGLTVAYGHWLHLDDDLSKGRMFHLLPHLNWHPTIKEKKIRLSFAFGFCSQQIAFNTMKDNTYPFISGDTYSWTNIEVQGSLAFEVANNIETYLFCSKYLPTSLMPSYGVVVTGIGLSYRIAD